MYIGIKYEDSINGVNNSLKKYGSATMFYGKTCYYFKNPILALKVSKILAKKVKNTNYSLCKLEKEEIKDKIFIKSFADFENYINEQNEIISTL